MKDADLDTAEESSKLDGMMKFSDTDTIGGKHIPLNLLIEELGVMRGVWVLVAYHFLFLL